MKVSDQNWQKIIEDLKNKMANSKQNQGMEVDSQQTVKLHHNKDGSLDMRYKNNRKANLEPFHNLDGSLDMRYRINREKLFY